MWGLLLNRYVIGALAGIGLLAVIFWAGDHYGTNAHAYAKCKTETARRNAAVASVNRSETAKHAAEEAAREIAATAFAGCADQLCPLTEKTATCLNLLSD